MAGANDTLGAWYETSIAKLYVISTIVDFKLLDLFSSQWFENT